MQKMNWNRLILGGSLAGLVINICEFLVDGLVLGDQWAASMKSLNRPPMGAGPTAAFMLGGNTVHLRGASRRFSDGRLGPLTCQESGMAITRQLGLAGWSN